MKGLPRGPARENGGYVLSERRHKHRLQDWVDRGGAVEGAQLRGAVDAEGFRGIRRRLSGVVTADFHANFTHILNPAEASTEPFLLSLG